MKNILFISYYFPPQRSVGKARSERVIKALNSNDITATVLSVYAPDKQFHPVENTPYLKTLNGHAIYYVPALPLKWIWQLPVVVIKNIARLFKRQINEGELSQKFLYIDLEYNWIIPCIVKALRLARQTKFDAIYVSTPPFSSIVAAVYIKKRLGIPLIVDLQDAWTKNTYRSFTKRECQTESAMLKHVDHMLVTSWSDQKNYKNRMAGNISLLFNSLNHFPQIVPQKNEILTLLYTGAWGTFESSPDSLIKALSQVSFPWRLISIPHNEEIEQIAQQYQVAHKIQQHDYMPRQALDRFYSIADLLFITKGKPRYGDQIDTHISAKLIDYCAIGRPVLAELPEGDSLSFLKKFCGKYYHVYPRQHEELVNQLEQAYSDWQTHQTISVNADKFCEQFSTKKVTQQIIEQIKKLMYSK